MEIEFNEALAFLFSPARLKIAYGGRGAGKSDGYAIALIVFAMKMKLRVLCLREIQNSLEESVKSTIENYIDHYNLGWAFDIKDKSIICKTTGSKFLFSGLRHKINSIKSLSKIDIAWIDEANNTSNNSLDKLMPTIRGKHESDPNGMGGPFKLGPEVWISFNPELDDDAVYKRYVIDKELYAPDYIPNETTGELERYAYVIKVNYSDNKWFPPDLKREMNLLKTNNPQKYLEVWEGFTKQTLDGAIYAEEIKACLLDGRRKHVPYDPQKPVFTAWDLGSRDKTAIWFIQKVGLEFNLIDYYENRLKKIGHYIEVLQEKKYNYSVHYLPHDADNETLANRSIATLVRKAYPNAKVTVVQRPAKKAVGVNAARTVFELCNFDEKLTADGWQCLSRYAYKVDEDTGSFSKEPDHDTPWSHGCFTADTKILTREGLKAISALPKTGEVLTQWGWRSYVNPQMTRKNASLVEVRFTSGYTVKCTPDHLFLTAKGWISAERLEKGMLIQSGLTKQHNSLIIKFTGFMKESNILKRMALYTGMFGRTLLAPFQKVATYITGMKLNLIAQLKILNAYLGKNTYSLAGNYILKDMALENSVMMLEKKLKIGTEHQKVELGINNMPKIKNLVKILKRNSSIALSVLGLLKRQTENVDGANGVQSNVDMLCLSSVERLDEKQNVYCLTVPSVGNFCLENGAIVHNCDAFQTFALSLKTEADTKKPKREDARVPVSQQSRGWMGAI